jgi:uncharacterized protein YvpB
MLALDFYANTHGGQYPGGQSSSEGSLSLLYKEGLLDADTLRGKSVQEETLRRVLASGALLGPETCGWHYVQGLTKSDNNHIAVLWDKVGLGHYGERNRHASREVAMVDGSIKWISGNEWQAFEAEQARLLKERSNSEAKSATSFVADVSSPSRHPMDNSESTVLLNVGFHHQKHALSCEPAALKIVLDYLGVHLSEDKIIRKLPFDKTPHKGSVWGDPDQGFVGNIDGEMPEDGYGIHWRPLAETARNWKRAEVIENGSCQDLARHLLADRPVIVWGFYVRGKPVTWHTVAGKTVDAVDGEHTRVVCGFRGQAADPDGFFVMDPDCGRAYWPKALFLGNWDAFKRCGVVVYH